METDNACSGSPTIRGETFLFHYGCWMMNPVYGWVWALDYTWGPAWVFWRHAETDGAIGWAALPPGAVFVDGGFLFNGVHVGVDFEFGLGEDCFTFVDYGHFHERYGRWRGRHEYRYHVDHERLHEFYHRSVVRNEFHLDNYGRFVNNGIGHERMDHLDSTLNMPGWKNVAPRAIGKIWATGAATEVVVVSPGVKPVIARFSA